MLGSSGEFLLMPKDGNRIQNYGGLGLMGVGVVFLILAVVFFFIPIDGPVGEIAFGGIGVSLILLGARVK